MKSLHDNLLMKQVMTNVNIDDAPVASTYIDMSTVHTGIFVASRGAAGAGALIDSIQLVQASDSGGTGKKVITGAVAPAVTGFVVATDLVLLELDAIAMDFENNFTFAAIEIGADADNLDVFASAFFVGTARYKGQELNLSAADFLLNFKKVPG